MQPPQGYGPPQMPSQQPRGHPYPQYGPPQMPSQVPPKKSKLKWILGVAIVLLVLLLFAGCSALVSGINGGGSHEEKTQAMIARADNLPESDWKLVGRSDPKVESGCLSIDIPCVRLNATWSVPHEVSWEETASRLGMDLEAAKTGIYSGCREAEEGGGGTAMLCINPSEKAENTWHVTIQLRAR